MRIVENSTHGGKLRKIKTEKRRESDEKSKKK